MEAGAAQYPGGVRHYGPMEIEIRPQNGGLSVEVRGEIDYATVEALKAELEGHGNQPIVLDLNDVEFMDIAGVTLLLAAAGRVTLGRVSAPVERLIRSCGLETELRLA